MDNNTYANEKIGIQRISLEMVEKLKIKNTNKIPSKKIVGLNNPAPINPKSPKMMIWR
jgi:hypothetical protein